MPPERSVGDRTVDLTEAIETHGAVLESGAYGSQSLGHWQFAAVEADRVSEVRQLAANHGFVDAEPPAELAEASEQFGRVRDVVEGEAEVVLLCVRDEDSHR